MLWFKVFSGFKIFKPVCFFCLFFFLLLFSFFSDYGNDSEKKGKQKLNSFNYNIISLLWRIWFPSSLVCDRIYNADIEYTC